ncbi:unnamed protein product [Ceratitis capitata]|uniref:(Mediterranean fruit fly) hypothetical protein n=1 Tax=Ceratitis capitata TaxID=7213 RepID=A0A811VFU7_CERCA|nr:unnamed protein product [Ceratitis capitata]
MFLNDAMEIDRADVTLLEVLGEVRLVWCDAEHPPLDDERAFRREIEVMKSVEPHPNIVGIIGHCHKPSHQMLLLTEYCSFGNLLDFLSAPPPPPTPLQSPTSYWAADNKSYGYEDTLSGMQIHMNVDSVGKKHATSLNVWMWV